MQPCSWINSLSSTSQINFMCLQSQEFKSWLQCGTVPNRVPNAHRHITLCTMASGFPFALHTVHIFEAFIFLVTKENGYRKCPHLFMWGGESSVWGRPRILYFGGSDAFIVSQNNRFLNAKSNVSSWYTSTLFQRISLYHSTNFLTDSCVVASWPEQLTSPPIPWDEVIIHFLFPSILHACRMHWE